jgi:hypothetical protein
MSDFKVIYEEFKVQSKDLVEKIKSLIHEGNIRRIIVKNQPGHTFLEIPLTFATIGVIAAPILAAVGAIAALVSDFSIVVEKREESPKGTESKTAAPQEEEDKKSNPVQ